MNALLIIDMQVGSFTSETPRYEAEKIVKRINLLSDYFRKNNDLVVFIQHDGTKENAFIPETENWKLLPSLVQKETDILISKTANDSFYKTELKKTLDNFGASKLFITGCATDFCVNTTVLSALHLDYKIVVVKDAHTTANRQYLKAKEVIQYFNWLWQNMIETKGNLEVIEYKEIIKP